MKTNTQFRIITSVLIVSLFAASAAATRLIGPWEYIYDGVSYATGSDESPRLMQAYAIRVDLANPSVSFKTTGGNGDWPLNTRAKSPSQFLEGQSLEVAINANFFDRVDDFANVCGVLRRNNTLVSGGEEAYPVQLRITEDNIASLIQATGHAGGLHTVIAGNVWLLTNGQPLGDNNDTDARTAVGLSQDTRFLIMLVVDAEEGATLLETGQWLKDFGAYQGMNLSGGNASCLVRSEMVDGMAVVLNNPADGIPRKVGANFGVNAFDRVPQRDIFIKGGDGNINHKYHMVGSEWSDWENLGAPAVGLASTTGAAAVSRMPGIIGLYTVGNKNLYHKSYKDGEWSGSWTSLGNGDLTGNAGVCSWNQDRVDVFCRNTSNNLMQKTWTTSGDWGNWVNRGGTILSGPAAVSWGPGRIDLFARSTSNTLLQKTYADGSWGNWIDHGDAIIGMPAACARKQNNLHVFWRAPGNKLMHKRYRGPLAGWAAATEIGQDAVATPGAVSRDPDFVTVFVPRGDGYVWARTRIHHEGGQWGRWYKYAGNDRGTEGGGIGACSWTNDAGTHQ